MIIFGIMMFGMMLAIGGLSFDIMRYEAHRERLQSTLDRAVLAAAALTQTQDRKAVVIDYLTKAGLGGYIDADDIIVTTALNSAKVEATARINVPLHHGTFKAFTSAESTGGNDNVLLAEAHSIAQESIGDVEISLVLDVSGSMGSSNRLEDLKDAAQDFLDTVYDAAEPGAVTTSVVPYATQVNAGPTLLGYFQRDDSHEDSHCLNFETTDYNSTAMSLATPYEQNLHFDPFMNGWQAGHYGYNIGNALWWPNCATSASRQIMPWSSNKQALKDFIETFYADGNTSTDIGAKWGAAMLDPSLQTVVTGMITSSDVPGDAAGRPFNYHEAEAMKVMVIMTDGDNTISYHMDDYRSGDSFVWKYVTGDDVYYSIWHDGEGSTPDTSYNATTQSVFVGYDREWVCTWWRWGRCWSGYYRDTPVYEDQDVIDYNWFVVYNTNFDGGGSTRTMWQATPYDDSDQTDGGPNAQRMTWDEVWAEIPPKYFSDDILDRMGTLTSTEENEYRNAVDSIHGGEKNTNLATICEKAKENGVIIFTIGLVITSSNASRLTTCASSASHYYNVTNLDLDNAFQSIAGQINQLRLTQ